MAEENANAQEFIRQHTVGFTHCDAKQCLPYSNIRTLRESGIVRAMTQLRSEGWNEDYNVVAIEIIPEDEEARQAYPTPLSEFTDMSVEEVILYIVDLEIRFAHVYGSFFFTISLSLLLFINVSDPPSFINPNNAPT